MLTREFMGLAALGILWINTLLIVAAAYKEIAKLRAHARRLEGLLHGKVVKGDGDDGALATHAVEQTGHAAGDGPEKRAILFHDRGFAGACKGGKVLVDGEELDIAPSREASVWVTLDALKKSAVCLSDEQFDAAYVDAKRGKGFRRTVVARIDAGAEVWAARDGSFVSTIEPRAFFARKTTLAWLSIVGMLVGAAACTALALTPPVFGTVSIVGAALGLAFFLLVQPAGTALRAAVRTPDVAWLRGEWHRGEPAPSPAPTSLESAAKAD